MTDVPDPAVSVYVGGNMTIEQAAESEGTIVVDGNLTSTTGPIIGLTGKVLWGMGYYGSPLATSLAVGGNATTPNGRSLYAGGNTQIGGTATNIKTTNRQTLKDNNHADWESMYKAHDEKTSVVSHMGKTRALQVDTDGDGKSDLDYNNYVSKNLIPLSQQLDALPNTGRVSFGIAPAVPNYGWQVAVGNSLDPNETRPSPYIKVSLPSEYKLTFHGDGQKHRQVFTLDLDQMKNHYYDQDVIPDGGYSLAFNNIPDGQPIIINVTSRNKHIDWWPGWRVWVDGVDYSTAVNKRDASLSRFRSIASRIMWNFPATTSMTLKGGPISQYAEWKPDTKKWYIATQTGQTNGGVLFPGSILLPNGSMYDIGDTNGRLLIGKNLTFHIWEHHNAPWIGFDEPQCFAISGKTTATLQ